MTLKILAGETKVLKGLFVSVGLVKRSPCPDGVAVTDAGAEVTGFCCCEGGGESRFLDFLLPDPAR